MDAHQVIWSVIDEIARLNNMSLCQLARLSGLDITSLLRNKRYSRNRQPRWPSAQTIHKILTAVHMDVLCFAKLVHEIQSQAE